MPLLDDSYEMGFAGDAGWHDEDGRGYGGGESVTCGELSGSNGFSHDWGCGFSRGEGSGEGDSHGSTDGSGCGEGDGNGAGALNGSNGFDYSDEDD